jgi:hypothetical protein
MKGKQIKIDKKRDGNSMTVVFKSWVTEKQFTVFENRDSSLSTILHSLQEKLQCNCEQATYVQRELELLSYGMPLMVEKLRMKSNKVKVFGIPLFTEQKHTKTWKKKWIESVPTPKKFKVDHQIQFSIDTFTILLSPCMYLIWDCFVIQTSPFLPNEINTDEIQNERIKSLVIKQMKENKEIEDKQKEEEIDGCAIDTWWLQQGHGFSFHLLPLLTHLFPQVIAKIIHDYCPSQLIHMLQDTKDRTALPMEAQIQSVNSVFAQYIKPNLCNVPHDILMQFKGDPTCLLGGKYQAKPFTATLNMAIEFPLMQESNTSNKTIDDWVIWKHVVMPLINKETSPTGKFGISFQLRGEQFQIPLWQIPTQERFHLFWDWFTWYKCYLSALDCINGLFLRHGQEVLTAVRRCVDKIDGFEPERHMLLENWIQEAEVTSVKTYSW